MCVHTVTSYNTWSRIHFSFLFYSMALPFVSVFGSSECVCVWAIHLPNRNCIKLNECMQHYFVHTDVEVLFRLFGIHCKAFCTITNSKAMFCSVHAAAQLEPFTQTIFEHTLTNTHARNIWAHKMIARRLKCRHFIWKYLVSLFLCDVS